MTTRIPFDDYRVNASTGEAYVFYRFHGRPIGWSNSTTLRYLLADHLHSTHSEVSSAATELSQRRNYPFGSDRPVSGASDLTTDERYTSQRRIDDGNANPKRELYSYRARWYLPGVGIFTQPDPVVPHPLNPQSLNRYAYVLNNPLRHTDPSGLQDDDDGGDDGGDQDGGDGGDGDGGDGGDGGNGDARSEEDDGAPYGSVGDEGDPGAGMGTEEPAVDGAPGTPEDPEWFPDQGAGADVPAEVKGVVAEPEPPIGPQGRPLPPALGPGEGTPGYPPSRPTPLAPYEDPTAQPGNPIDTESFGNVRPLAGVVAIGVGAEILSEAGPAGRRYGAVGGVTTLLLGALHMAVGIWIILTDDDDD